MSQQGITRTELYTHSLSPHYSCSGYALDCSILISVLKLKKGTIWSNFPFSLSTFNVLALRTHLNSKLKAPVALE